MLADAARHPYVVTVEDGLREGGIGSAIRDALAELTIAAPHAPRVRVLGTPCAYINHGSPDALLAQLGLDATGVATSGRELVHSSSLTSPMSKPARSLATARSLQTTGVL